MTLPTVGGGEDAWGTTLNAHINIEHNTDGTHKATEVTAVVTGEGIFGSWTNLDSDGNALTKTNVYRVGSDGFLLVRDTYAGGTTDTMELFTDSSNPPTTLIAESFDTDGSTRQTYNVPIRKNDYWKVSWNHTLSIYWLPIGTGDCVKQ